jgi:steroid 5-alpha reductase family enzyme
LVFFGVALFFNEWLLRWIVAGILVFVGLLLTMLGLRLKRMLG